MKKIILLAALVAGGVALSATAFAQTASQTASLIPVLSLLLFGQDDSGDSGDSGGSGGTGKLNDTGIVTSVAANDDANYGRDADNETNSNEDGHAGFDFIKLDSDGTTLAASASSWSCVQDDVTGLVWSLDKGVSDVDGIQTILDTANDTANNGSTPLCGESGWRLPTVKELVGIVDYHKTSGAMIELTFFNDIQADWYWTSTDDAASGSTDKWGVTFSTAEALQVDTLSTANSGDEHRVLLVR